MADISKYEMAEAILSFVNGTCGDWDWDDLTSVKQREPEMEAIRLRLIAIHDDHPSPDGRGYCNEEGLAELRRIAASLKSCG